MVFHVQKHNTLNLGASVCKRLGFPHSALSILHKIDKIIF